MEKYSVKLIGAKLRALRKTKGGHLFKETVKKIDSEIPARSLAYTLTEALGIAEKLDFPLIIRPSFTLGSTGGGVACNMEEFKQVASNGFMLSPISEILIEQSVIGWKEYELEVMRDVNGNVVIVCSIENFDSTRVHTGDFITGALIQTLTDRGYQCLRDTSAAIMREIGVKTERKVERGKCNKMKRVLGFLR